MIGVDRLPSMPLVLAAALSRCPYCACLNVQDLDRTQAGKPRAPATTRRLATFRSETAEDDDRRPNLLGLAEAHLGRLDILVDHRQAGDGGRLAPEGFPLVLDVEDTPGQAGSPWRTQTGS